MTSICLTPYKQSLAQVNKFQLVFPRISNTTFFCTEVKIPGITLSEADAPNPFVDLKVPGDKLTYDTLDITFLVDSEYKSFNDILVWLTGLGFPENFDQYAGLGAAAIRRGAPTSGIRPPYSDAQLLVFTNKGNYARKFYFKDAFPLNLGGIDMTYAGGGASIVMKCTASFRYSYYNLIS